MADTNLITIKIRNSLNKGERIGTNDIRYLLALVDSYRNRIQTLERELEEAKSQPEPEVTS
jgi:hypothetical protein